MLCVIRTFFTLLILFWIDVINGGSLWFQLLENLVTDLLNLEHPILETEKLIMPVITDLEDSRSG